MKTIVVKLKERSYPIVFRPFDSEEAQNMIERAAGKNSLLTVTDPNVRAAHPLAVYRYGKTHILTGGEEHKTIEEVVKLCSFAVNEQLDRKSLFVAVGGGVVGDMAGFAAAIFMRGVDFIQVPTTLLAMVDSSVGGKTGVDIPEGKNLIGAFHQPKLVVVDTGFLETLPERELANGLAEVVKYGASLDGEFFALLEENTDKILHHDWDFYRKMIHRSCSIKADVVAQDEREGSVRALLNYGHTFGHAIENLSGYQVSHGEGVAIGMVLAGKTACKLGLWEESQSLRQENLLKKLHLPVRIPGNLDSDGLLDAMLHDKKSVGGKINLVLPTGIGSAVLCPAPAREVLKNILESTYE